MRQRFLRAGNVKDDKGRGEEETWTAAERLCNLVTGFCESKVLELFKMGDSKCEDLR